MANTNQINEQRIDELNEKILHHFQTQTDLKPLIPSIENVIQGLIDDKFDEQGPGWKKIIPIRQGQILSDTGQLAASIQVQIVPSDKGYKIELSEKFYGKFHEYGARITVTPKSRRFFWYKYKATGNEIWKWMALTKKKFFVLPIREHLELTEQDFKEISLVIQELVKIS